ncbi:hypothetical protein PILCRDRAFT_212313 [Piloderma croceum F 1598]|uniref:DUF6534 domain-containing protein n=1 Tax=Piloderma croceum (strain F 1598) TaxID=765440 RepID=A0A0C3GEN9_PILCF|nr:hypothetical protein PILCRDRAFT_212313 [Piloderma croceum F 1598]
MMAKNPAEIALGPILIGTVFNILLYGVMITQVYLYFSTYKKDQKWLKCLVLFLFLADTSNAVFDLIYVYDALIINFNNVEYLSKATRDLHLMLLFKGIISACVQFFFAWRIKILTKDLSAVILIVTCAIVNMVAAIATSIAIGFIPIFIEAERFKVAVITWLVAAVVADVLISVSLTYHLQKHKSGFAVTDDVVNRIIRLTVQTGAVTAVCAIIDLVFFLVDTSGNHLMFNVPLSKLYTNSLMSSLNARGGWKFSQRSDEPTSVMSKSQVCIMAFTPPFTSFTSLLHSKIAYISTTRELDQKSVVLNLSLTIANYGPLHRSSSKLSRTRWSIPRTRVPARFLRTPNQNGRITKEN